MSAGRIIAAARDWIGTPYQHQASCKGVGCDCLGLVRGVWRDLYGYEPEVPPAYSMDWAEATGAELMRNAARRHMAEIPVAAAAPGDLILFRMVRRIPARHAAILSHDRLMIHACSGHAVREEPISRWARRAAYAFRFPPMPQPIASVACSNTEI